MLDSKVMLVTVFVACSFIICGSLVASMFTMIFGGTINGAQVAMVFLLTSIYMMTMKILENSNARREQK
jgi:hypothetical protein